MTTGLLHMRVTDPVRRQPELPSIAWVNRNGRRGATPRRRFSSLALKRHSAPSLDSSSERNCPHDAELATLSHNGRLARRVADPCSSPSQLDRLPVYEEGGQMVTGGVLFCIRDDTDIVG
jgi:hypothetical protein